VVGTTCNTVALYDLRSSDLAGGPVRSHEGGVTQVRFSPDGDRLYSVARNDSFVVCRDVRNFTQVLQQFPRPSNTDRRGTFDLTDEGKYLCTGNTNGTVFIWNLRELSFFKDNKCTPNLHFTPHTSFDL